MSDSDVLTALAEQVATGIFRRLPRMAEDQQSLQDMKKASRNEWMRWLQIMEKRGLDKAIRYARVVSQSSVVRENIRNLNHCFAESLVENRSRLLQLPDKGQRTVLGYVGWWLRILERETGKPSEEQPQRRREGAQPQRPSRPRR